MAINVNELKALKQQFESVEKRCLRYESGITPLTKNQVTLNGYVEDLVATYNNINEYIEKYAKNFDEKTKHTYYEKIKALFGRVNRCAAAIKHTVLTPSNIFSKISKTHFTNLNPPIQSGNELEESFGDTETHGAWSIQLASTNTPNTTGVNVTSTAQNTFINTPLIIQTHTNSVTTSSTADTTLSTAVNNIVNLSSSQTFSSQVQQTPFSGIFTTATTTVPTSIISNQNIENINLRQVRRMNRCDYLNLCARTVNQPYTGDPIALTPLINAIDLLTMMDEQNIANLVMFQLHLS